MPTDAQPDQDLSQRRRQHWVHTRQLAILTLCLWMLFAVGIHLILHLYGPVSVFGFTLSFYMAAQGSILLFILLIFAFAHIQERIDRNSGLAEDD